MNPELKKIAMDSFLPCPFCGCEEIIPGEMIGDSLERFRLRCGNCRCYVGNFETRGEAIIAWNTRYPIKELESQ